MNDKNDWWPVKRETVHGTAEIKDNPFFGGTDESKYPSFGVEMNVKYVAIDLPETDESYAAELVADIRKQINKVIVSDFMKGPIDFPNCRCSPGITLSFAADDNIIDVEHSDVETRKDRLLE